SVSVVRLYAGAILPGFLLAGLYMIYVIGRATLNPKLAPKPREEDVGHLTPVQIFIQMLTSFFPLAFLILSVLGAILFGLATPSEAASMGAVGALLLAIGYRLAAIRAGTVTPEWMRNGARPYNEWLYALGVGGISAVLLYIAYFVIRLLAHSIFGLPLPTERTLPGFPFSGVILAFAIAAAVRFGGERVPFIAFLQPKVPALKPVMVFAGEGGVLGLALGALYLIMFTGLDLGQYFADQEFTPWALDAGFFVSLLGYTAWRVIDKNGLRESVYLSVRTSAMVCWLFVGSWTFSSVFSYLGGHSLIEEFVLGLNLSTIGFLLLAQFIIFLLGWPLEWSEIIIIFVPIFLPMLPHFGVDPLFFGILVALNLQTSFLTPPMAMAAYYLKGVAPPHIQLVDIFKGVLPFLSMVFLAMLIVYLFPEIILWLPKIVYGR
ncbi:MAG: TRAP transporter large permease subunit, partial [Alphaproteobacteria bacterium]